MLKLLTEKESHYSVHMRVAKQSNEYKKIESTTNCDYKQTF